jgi:hypothetical protein
MSVEMQLDNAGRVVEQHAERCTVITAQEFEAG